MTRFHDNESREVSFSCGPQEEPFVLKELQEKSRPFKYVITSVIMQKTGAGLVTATSMNWDTTKDGYCKIPWQNNTMHCIVTIYGAAVTVDDPQDD